MGGGHGPHGMGGGHGPHGMGGEHGPHGRGGPGGARQRNHLVPTLLVLLRKGPQHGYALLGKLEETLPHSGAMPDVSSVYRTLADLAEEGAVTSHWEAGEGGGRRVYELTPLGDEMLEAWLAQLETQYERLGRLIKLGRE